MKVAYKFGGGDSATEGLDRIFVNTKQKKESLP